MAKVRLFLCILSLINVGKIDKRDEIEELCDLGC